MNACTKKIRPTPDVTSKDNSIPFVRLIALSIVSGLVLEAGQLFGAPFASVLCFTDWSKKSVLIYTFLSFFIGWFAIRFNWTARAKKVIVTIRIFFVEHGKPFALCVISSIISAIILASLATALTGYSEPLPLGLFSFSFFLTASVALGFRKYIAKKTEWFFLLCILSLGISFITLSPIATSYSYDDHIHYGNAVALSYLDNRAFSMSDQSILDPSGPPLMQFEVEELLDSWSYFQEGAYIPFDSYNQSVLYQNSLTKYSSLGYIPSAIGLYLGRILHLPYALIFDFGKFLNLIFFSVMIFMGMRKLTSKKTIACAVMLLPNTVFLGCNYSCDPWLISLLFYALASFVGILQSGTIINRSDMIKMLAAFLLGLGPKAIYFPLLFLLLLVPKKQFKGNVSIRMYYLAVLSSVLIALASFALPLFVGGVGSDLRGELGVNANEQIQGIVSNPFGYCWLLVSFATSYLSPLSALEYTTQLGYIGANSYLSIVFYLWLLVSAFLDNGLKENLSFSNAKTIIPCFAAVAFSLIGIFSALYITYTVVGSPTIEGVQGRYLIPLLFIFLALCLNFKMPRILSREAACFISISVSSIGLYTVFFLQFVSLWIG